MKFLRKPSASTSHDKEHMIDFLLHSGVYKMSDGRQLYESSMDELMDAYKQHADHCWEEIYF
ncbi:Fur-regulated basic protein FbpA [Bacillaceae bacterium SIJ1]|uniref:Fur-regulated basic protein FbpA n=1 Tax=Litoribacterium kuwaitense TaxID=1398745 RepID=UPI0013EC53D0|nr:Fur-regulated basic protein FbpA [Litoribacterium kuwaitense]NGP44748.1 Fur-regulated basic protein FbpA [Litoribacterium kuwaitense]